MVLWHSCPSLLLSPTLLLWAMKGSLLNNSVLFCFSFTSPPPTHIHYENVSLFKALVYSLSTINHWYTICHRQAVCAKSLFWQRFYTIESKLKGSYQQTLLKNPSLYLRGKYFHIPSASRETGRHKLPLHTHTHLNHRLSSPAPSPRQVTAVEIKMLLGLW